MPLSGVWCPSGLHTDDTKLSHLLCSIVCLGWTLFGRCKESVVTSSVILGVRWLAIYNCIIFIYLFILHLTAVINQLYFSDCFSCWSWWKSGGGTELSQQQAKNNNSLLWSSNKIRCLVFINSEYVQSCTHVGVIFKLLMYKKYIIFIYYVLPFVKLNLYLITEFYIKIKLATSVPCG